MKRAEVKDTFEKLGFTVPNDRRISLENTAVRFMLISQVVKADEVLENEKSIKLRVKCGIPSVIELWAHGLNDVDSVDIAMTGVWTAVDGIWLPQRAARFNFRNDRRALVVASLEQVYGGPGVINKQITTDLVRGHQSDVVFGGIAIDELSQNLTNYGRHDGVRGDYTSELAVAGFIHSAIKLASAEQLRSQVGQLELTL